MCYVCHFWSRYFALKGWGGSKMFHPDSMGFHLLLWDCRKPDLWFALCNWQVCSTYIYIYMHNSSCCILRNLLSTVVMLCHQVCTERKCAYRGQKRELSSTSARSLPVMFSCTSLQSWRSWSTTPAPSSIKGLSLWKSTVRHFFHTQKNLFKAWSTTELVLLPLDKIYLDHQYKHTVCLNPSSCYGAVKSSSQIMTLLQACLVS